MHLRCDGITKKAFPELESPGSVLLIFYFLLNVMPDGIQWGVAPLFFFHKDIHEWGHYRHERVEYAVTEPFPPLLWGKNNFTVFSISL